MDYLNASTLVYFLLPNISGYLDPGSGAAVLAMIMGVLAGAGMTLKLYWFKIKEKMSRR